MLRILVFLRILVLLMVRFKFFGSINSIFIFLSLLLSFSSASSVFVSHFDFFQMFCFLNNISFNNVLIFFFFFFFDYNFLISFLIILKLINFQLKNFLFNLFNEVFINGNLFRNLLYFLIKQSPSNIFSNFFKIFLNLFLIFLFLTFLIFFFVTFFNKIYFNSIYFS